MKQMEIFKNPEFGAIRAVEIDGEPWLVGKDVSLALGYTNPQKAIRDHVDAEDRTVNDSFTVNGTAITLINESGLYSLVLSSKLPKAKQFRRWVTSEVLPTIRKHGAYMTKEKLWEVATSPEALLKLCSDLLAEREENAVLREEKALLESKAAFYDLFIDLNHSTNLRTTAKELVVPERRFVRFLLEQRFVYRTASGNVLPYHQQRSQGADGGPAGTAGPQRPAHFPHGFGCRRPPGGPGKEKVRHGATEKPAQGGTQKGSAQKERRKGNVIWETSLLRKRTCFVSTTPAAAPG